MPRSLTQIYIHAIWAVKNRAPVLTNPIRARLIQHIYHYFQHQPLKILRINGMEDHLHCLFVLPASLSLANAMKLLKGESSHWLNQQQLLDGLFKWQGGYAAFSVDKTTLPSVISYIDRQEHHDRINT